jgi:aerobic carbon-monoxide dehydrogenase small subunit
MSQHTVSLVVNGKPASAHVSGHTTLLELLRDYLGLVGTKNGCAEGDCGACTVIMNDQPVKSCLVLAVQANGATIGTVEGLAGLDGRLHPLQEAFIECGAVQCGFCTPGVLMAAKGLLDRNPAPTRQEIREALAGNLCRCTGYVKIFAAVELAASRLGARR